jgi:hypothetical protein
MTNSLKFLSILALISLAAATAACTTQATDEDQTPRLGTTTNSTVPIAPAVGDEASMTVQDSKLPILMKEPLLWEPVENATPVDPPVVHVRPSSGPAPHP